MRCTGEVDASCMDVLGQGKGEVKSEGLVGPFGWSVASRVRGEVSCFGSLGEKGGGGCLELGVEKMCMRGWSTTCKSERIRWLGVASKEEAMS